MTSEEPTKTSGTGSQGIRLAAENGNASAQLTLGRMLLESNAEEEGYKWISAAARNGDSEALSELRDAAHFDASRDGNMHAQYELGMMLLEGAGVVQSTSEANIWLRKSAEQGNKNARRSLKRAPPNQANTGPNKATQQGSTNPEVVAYLARRKANSTVGELARQAEHGCGEAMEKLVQLARGGDSEAIKELVRLAKAGNNEAMEELTWMAVDNSDVRKRLERLVESGFYTTEGLVMMAQRGIAGALEALEEQAAEEEALEEQVAEDDLDSYSLCCLGQMYLDGSGADQSYLKAMEWFKKAAERKEANTQYVIYAQYVIGWMHLTGRGVARSDQMAAEWFEKAAKQGDVNAQCQLGWIYARDRGIKGSREKAAEWFEKAAKQDSTEARHALDVMREGDAYGDLDSLEKEAWLKLAEQIGSGEPEESGESASRKCVNCDGTAEWLARLAYEGDDEAMDEIERMAGEGSTEALETLERLAASDGADGYVCYRIGQMYYDGETVEKSYAEAAEWFRRAAEQGDAYAQFMLGVMYNGGRGVKRSAATAAEWFRKAAEQGECDAQYNLGIMYLDGRGVERSSRKGAEWIRKAAEQGDSEAQYVLGTLLLEGARDGRNPPAAVAWLRKAAEQRNLYAIQALGDIHEEDGDPRCSSAEVLEKLERSAEMGDANAQYMLGKTYLDGPRSEWPEGSAYRWISSAARNGHGEAYRRLTEDADGGNAYAQYELGMMRLRGEGVKQSKDRALELLRKAADAGVPEAERELDRIKTAKEQNGNGGKTGGGPVRRGLKRLFGRRSRDGRGLGERVTGRAQPANDLVRTAPSR